ncbi:hypothetical protein FFLO_03347 [Filobasidium floriforme]|uniref:Vacuolar fusion protein MON1 n=1 Tax=Filobasidium floriforme TaxID=5210 RepID=A0A8K0NT70_9TREE|nr:protein-vacuolar targeting protein [Filobasidium floriforme]KAG7544234.1 hypothetical protein FFLO_03347 [Filobasidium floriforme]KAH8085742.1 protein-vacuolar targeting protein [Filobasidium floriforme]
MSLGIPQAGPSRSRTPSLYLGQKEGSIRSRSRGLSPSSTGNSTSSLSPSLSSSPSREIQPESVEQNGTGTEAGGSNLADARIGLKRLISRDLTTNPISKPTLSPTLSPNISGNGEAKGTDRGMVLGNGKGKEREVGFSPRRYYILTHAGKPVFDSLEVEEDQTTNMMGVIQALISIYAESEDKLRSIKRGRHKIVFLLRSPVYLFGTSDWGEPDFVLRTHLELLHLQLLSIVTEVQLKKVFARQSNFNLRRLLEGTETSLHTLLNDMQMDLTFMTSALQPMRMAPALRDAAGQALAPTDKISDLLYVLLLVNDKVVTLLRPRKHSIHPTDLHLLMNVLRSSPGLKSSETWLPLCLPKFNPNGFVYALIDYVKDNIGLIFVSADREGFEPLQAWKKSVVKKLEMDNMFSKLEMAGLADPYLCIDPGYPGLRHFWYKSRQNVQVTMPVWEAPYDEPNLARRRLVTIYQRLYDGIHARSGQAEPLKQAFIRTDSEACLGWITPSFELYVAVDAHLPKSAAVAAANAVARWVRKQEAWMFLREAPVF